MMKIPSYKNGRRMLIKRRSYNFSSSTVSPPTFSVTSTFYFFTSPIAIFKMLICENPKRSTAQFKVENFCQAFDRYIVPIRYDDNSVFFFFSLFRILNNNPSMTANNHRAFCH